MKNIVIGVDLAKNLIQVCIYTNKKVHSNVEMTHGEFLSWLFNFKPSTIIFEACSSSNYWRQKAIEAGHKAYLISAKLVATVRQNQKTDANDALAIVQASLLPEINFIPGKNIEQQQLQTIIKLRNLANKQKTALSNQLKGLLLEFNIRVSSKTGGIKGTIEELLEDHSNGFSDEFRSAISTALDNYLKQLELLIKYEKCLEHASNKSDVCKRFRQLEGIGPINAINLYLTIGCSDFGAFSTGKDVSVSIGVTPVQHSSGGKTKLGSISKRTKHSLFRSQLVNGSMAVLRQVVSREPRTKKEAWLKGVYERRGIKCAAIALANKNIRTAFAMFKNNTQYHAEPLAA